MFYGWWIVGACFFIAAYVAGAIFFGFTAFVEPLVNEFGWSYTRISLVAALRGLNMGIFAPVAGLLVDRYGSRRLILAGMILVGTGLILLGFTQTYAWFFGCFILLSMGAGGCTSVVLMTVTATWFRRHVGKAMGIVACGFGAGGALVPLNVWLIDAFSWRNAFFIIGAGMLATGIPLSLVIRNSPEPYGLRPDGDPAIEPAATDKASPSDPNVGFINALRDRSFIMLSITELVRMMAVTAVVMHVMPYLSSLGMSRVNAGLVASAIPLVSIIGRIVFGWLGDVYSKQKVMSISLAFMAGGLFMFAYVDNRWFLAPFLLLFSPGFGGNTSLRGAVIRDHFGVANFGKLLGIVMGVSSIGGIIGPTLAGWSFDYLGQYQFMWLVFTFAVALCGFMMLIIRPQQTRAGA